MVRDKNSRPPVIRPSGGFTLLELMIVLAIAGVLVSLALPAFTDMVKNNCQVSNANFIVSLFQQARSHAIKFRQDVTVNIPATPTNAWNVVRGNNVTMSQETLPCLQPDIVMSTTGGVAVTDGTAVTYTSRGWLNTAAVTIQLCDGREDETERLIALSAVGRPQVTTDNNCQ